MIIKNANVFLLKGSVNNSIEEDCFIKTDIQIENEKIKSIGDIKQNSNEEIIEASGKYLMPGYIDANSSIGLYEEAVRWEGNDTDESGRVFAPALRAIDGIKPNDTAFLDAIKSGITTVSVGQGVANIVGGKCCIISTDGIVIDNMIIKNNVALRCALGDSPRNKYLNTSSKEPFTDMGIYEVLRRTLFNAKNYRDKKNEYASKNIYFERDFDYEEMLDVIDKKIPLKIHANSKNDIINSLRLSKEFDVKVIIDGAVEASLVADYIKEAGVSVIVGNQFGACSSFELLNKNYETPKILFDKGIHFAITTSHPTIPQYALNICAMISVKHGLPNIEALKAITIKPAEILEIDNIKGKIKEGYDADLVLWNNHPLDIKSVADMVMIKGRKINI